MANQWELAIIDTRIFVTTLRSARGEVVGIGFKISSDSEQTSLINANAEVNSVWHVYLPGQGTFLIDQSENYWSYIHDIVIPARWSEAVESLTASAYSALDGPVSMNGSLTIVAPVAAANSE